ncbi:helix-turn-helix transcriptional regulator [Pseudoalteromonas peptidolytica]|uniref:helix-turn-helix transcriptional regulator n=1 Tax=Pseudoalteromonas peptidolytica TaxID=61150 RepID=UPI00298EC33F|nr:helix-turn-helix transcriptional regulator [Pseudoalteromonas peptidolytica]MDW7549026.1 helix-turn-helix transcriptional regulator [Pseudoalteromonas peptidolytica]
MSIVLDLHSKLLQQHFYDHVSQHELHTEVPLISTSISQVKLRGIIYYRNAQVASSMPEDYGSLILIQKGSGWWLTQQSISAADNMQLIFIEAEQKHIFHLPAHYHAISFNFPISWLVKHTGKRLSHGQAIKITPALSQLFTQALFVKQLTKTQAQWLEANILQSLSHALQCCHLHSPLTALKQLIVKHASNDALCIDMLCEYSGWSKRYIHKLFTRSDLSASEYLIRTRLNHAYFELVEQNSSLNQIAINSGFKSQAHFSRRFKQLFALSPKQIPQRVHS